MEKIDYNRRCFNEVIIIKEGDKNYEMDITLRGFDGKSDCHIGNFYYNFYFRTPYGMKYKKYTSVNKMKSAIERVIKFNGFKVVEWLKADNN